MSPVRRWPAAQRLKALTEVTRVDNSRFFAPGEEVPSFGSHDGSRYNPGGAEDSATCHWSQ